MEKIELDNNLTIQDVSIQMKIPKSTIRYWERTFYPLIQPSRTRGGQRRYNQAHIDIFNQVVRLKKQGKKISQIRHILEYDSSANSQHAPAKESVDLLVNRIAGFVNDEVTKFLSSIES